MSRRTIREIELSPLDEKFRHEALKVLKSAKEEILVVAGELTSFRYLELRLGIKSAIKKGVKVRVYATNPLIGTLNKLLMYGCEVYVGKRRVKDHYLIADRLTWIVSKEHPPSEIGVRKGEVHENDPEGARKLVEYLHELIREGERVKEPIWDQDPLLQALQNPPNWGWGEDVDLRKLDEEIGT